MQLIDDILYVSSKELVDSGSVSKGTVNKGLLRQRTGSVNCWQYKRFDNINGKWIEYPQDSRKGCVYIVYDSLKIQHQTSIKMNVCNGSDPVQYANNELARQKELKIAAFHTKITSELNIKSEYLNFFMDQGFDPDDVQRYARAAAWLDLYNNITRKQAARFGFDSMEALRSDVLTTIMAELDAEVIRFRGKRLSSLQVLYRHARSFKQQGCESLISGKIGLQNARLINDEQHAWLMCEYGKPTKISFEDVAMLYNSKVAVENNWPKLTTSAIRAHLNKPENKRVWYFSRHGVDAAKNEMDSLIKRRAVSFPDALVSIDGTALQLYYLEKVKTKVKNKKTGKIEERVRTELRSDLYIYLVTDVYSKSIVGWSVAFTETSEMVTEALKRYVFEHGYRPYQLQYDNSSANVATAVKALTKNMSKVAFPCKPYLGRAKYVEPYIGHFEQRVLRHFENFKGGSPKTKDLNSKANPDFLKSIKKELPTMDVVIQQFIKAVDEWNARGERRNQYGQFEGETRIKRYAHEHEKRKSLNYFEKLSLFMVELENKTTKDGTYKYGQQGVVIRINGNDRHYIVPDPDQIGDFIFQSLHLNQYFKVRINMTEPDMIELWRGGKKIGEAIEKEQYAACVADYKDGEGSKIKKYQFKQEQYGNTYSKTELDRQKAILESIGLGATGTDGFGWSDMSKINYNVQENAEVDAINGMNESDLVRKLKRIGN